MKTACLLEKSTHFYSPQRIDIKVSEKCRHNIICSKALLWTLITAH